MLLVTINLVFNDSNVTSFSKEKSGHLIEGYIEGADRQFFISLHIFTIHNISTSSIYYIHSITSDFLDVMK